MLLWALDAASTAVMILAQMMLKMEENLLPSLEFLVFPQNQVYVYNLIWDSSVCEGDGWYAGAASRSALWWKYSWWKMPKVVPVEGVGGELKCSDWRSQLFTAKGDANLPAWARTDLGKNQGPLCFSDQSDVGIKELLKDSRSKDIFKWEISHLRNEFAFIFKFNCFFSVSVS